MLFRRFLPLLLAAVLAAGCMNISSTLSVHPDGSGTLTERLVVPARFAQMMHSFQQMDDSTDSGEMLFSEEDIRERVDSLPGMRLESVTMLSDEQGEGYEAVYAFDDLRDVQFDPAPDNVLPQDAPQTGDDSPFDLLSAVDISFTPGTPATLTLRMPREMDETEPSDARPSDDPPTDEPSSEQEKRMMRAMMKDSGVRLAVRIEGEIVETNATHRSGSTITLIDMDFGRLAQDSTAFSRVMEDNQDLPSSRTALDSLNALPGMTIEPQETVTVRFQ